MVDTSNCPPPETPTESMEFLARSWSVSATELSKALCNTNTNTNSNNVVINPAPADNKEPLLTSDTTPPESPRGSDDSKELYLLHQALNPEFISSQQLLRNGLYRNLIMKRKTMGRWMKDQKERKKQEMRAQNAQLHAAVSVAGVAAAVAAAAAAASPNDKHKKPPKISPALASAAALVASHCIEIAEDMGADHDHILSVVNSAINARTNGDVMALTAAAATALRGAATLRARLSKELSGSTIAVAEESKISAALSFVSNGGDLLKRTRKGDLHWKQVSFNMNATRQVVAKMKSKHMGGTFTKKKKCVVSGVYSEIEAWREREGEEKAYFAIQTVDRVIQFECENREEKQMWVEGIQHMLHLHVL